MFNLTVLNDVASIGMACVLAVSSSLPTCEAKGLLTGEAAHPMVAGSILALARRCRRRLRPWCDDGTEGTEQSSRCMSAEFEDALTTPRIEKCIKRIDKQARPHIRKSSPFLSNHRQRNPDMRGTK